MSSNITAAVHVDRPIHVVYSQWTQFGSFPYFMEGVERIEQLDDTHLHEAIKVAPSTLSVVPR